jgi:outer membrane lipoprotein-sorting protein
MMRLAISLLIFFCLPASADDGLLGSLSGKAGNIESFSGTFVQHRKIVVLPLPLDSEGKFSYHHQTGMVWTTLRPVQSTVIISSRGIRMKEAESVRRTVGSPQVAKALLELFSGKLESLSEQFNIESSGSISDWRLQLTPKNDLLAAEITSIDIRGRETTESVSVADANGDRSDLTFTTHSIKFFEK